ncbi:MAG: FAD binding domain-containing protein [Planctomycetota bacterium]
MTDPSVCFVVNGRPIRLGDADALTSLSTLLRRRLGLIGTKVVCAEGDCGACTVLIGRPVENADGTARLDYRPIDACIVQAFQCRGTHVVTVEGLQGPTSAEPQAEPDPARLTVLQKAMVDGHGSQCGFCTPGIVMALHGLHEQTGAPQPLDHDRVRHGLSGNLCRCTGYQQIFDACAAVDPAKIARLAEVYDEAVILSMLEEQPGGAFTMTLSVPIGPGDRADQTPAQVDPASNGHPAPLQQSAAWLDGPALPSRKVELFLPTTLAEALRYKHDHPEALVVAGATDVGVWQSHGAAWPDRVLSITGLEELAGCHAEPDGFRLGAGATWRAVLDCVADGLPQWAGILERFGSPQIREMGTLGGNLANGSPIADSLPALFGMDAQVELGSHERGARRVPITEFYTGYKQTGMTPSELILAVHLPHLAENERLHLEKSSRRLDMDISTFTAAVRVGLSPDGTSIETAAVALGGVGPTVVRLPEVEALLCGRAFDEAAFRQAGALARSLIRPISDVRGAAEHRLRLAENVFLKAWHGWQTSRTMENV